MGILSKVFNLPVAGTVAILGGAIVLAARVMPKCMHGSEFYSFPQSPRREGVNGRAIGMLERIVYRTCTKCGNVRPYDWHLMRFIRDKELKAIKREAEERWVTNTAQQEDGAFICTGSPSVGSHIQEGTRVSSSARTVAVI